MNKKHSALIIDDEKDIRELIALTLDRIGLDTHTAANLDEARHLLAHFTFEVCLSDMKLPDGNGVDFISHIHEVQPGLPVAVITAHGNMEAAVEAMKNGAFDFVSKPVDIAQLRSLVQQAISLPIPLASHAANESTMQGGPESGNSPLDPAQSASSTDEERLHHASPGKQDVSLECLSQRQVAQQEHPLIGGENMVGNSLPMRELRTMIGKVSRTNAPVLITGESGTGKEVIARLIHRNSARHASSFVAINCGAIPTELMESEMFGHRKGSFTGAHTDYDGLFMQANRGTLFLDEVAELPLHMQVKLLRAIQEKVIRPVGSTTEIPVDVRILSASHKPLNNEIDESRFRHDLYYRLNVIELRAPSLRDRPDDILDLATHILVKLSKDGPAAPFKLDTNASSALVSYDFPGNVRELENILERAVALTDNQTISLSDLSISPVTSDSRGSKPSTQSKEGSDTQDKPVSSERELVLNALKDNRWNRKMAARQLGLTYRQLRYRIETLDINNE